MSNDVISRRGFVQRTAAGVGTMALGPTVLADRALAKNTVKPGGTLTMAITGDPKTLDVHRSTLDVLRHTIRSMVFESLIFVEPNLHVRPALATSWQVSPDGTMVTFKLRRGVRFHDGSPFTASDVAFTIQRVQNPATASQYAPQVAAVKQVQIVDIHTVRLHLSAPTPALITNLLFVPIVSEKSVGAIDKHPIGTGPFKFVEWIPGNHIKVVRNPSYYHKGLPQLDGIMMRPMPDDQVRITNLQTGAVLLDEEMDATDVKQVQTFPNAHVLATKPITLYEIFQINTQRRPFNDKRVRQALSYAFDRQSYVRSFWYGLARPGDNPFVKEMPAYLPGSDNVYTFDLNKTAALLKAAGFSQSKPLKMEILSPLGFSTLHAMAVLLQANLNKLGHNVTVRDLELSAWIDRISTHANFDVTTDNYNTVPEDPGGMFNSDNLAPSFNINRFNPPGYAALVKQAASEVNPQKRIQLYRTLQRFLLDEQPMIVVDHIPNLLGASKRLSGLVLGPSGIWDYARMTIG
jgi:ABC-type transport system substrate-binding protein